MIISPPQAKLLKELLETDDGEYTSAIYQLIMGGGKTAVLAALLLAKIPRKRIPIFLTPQMQLKTVSYALSRSLKQLNIELIDLNYKQEELNEANLKYISETIKNVKSSSREKSRQVIILVPETLQTLELEMHSLIKKHATAQINKEELNKIKYLQDILKYIHEYGDCIADEVDLVLAADKEVNFPSGTKIHISKPHIGLMREVFYALCKNDVEGKNLLELVQLPKKPASTS